MTGEMGENADRYDPALTGEENELRLRSEADDGGRRGIRLPEGNWPHKAGSYGPTVISGPLMPVARWLEKHESVFAQYLQHCRYTSCTVACTVYVPAYVCMRLCMCCR
jgi:hypothetical protein